MPPIPPILSDPWKWPLHDASHNHWAAGFVYPSHRDDRELTRDLQVEQTCFTLTLFQDYVWNNGHGTDKWLWRIQWYRFWGIGAFSSHLMVTYGSSARITWAVWVIRGVTLEYVFESCYSVVYHKQNSVFVKLELILGQQSPQYVGMQGQ